MAGKKKSPPYGPIRGEWKRLTSNKMTMVSMVGLMVIPLLYSGMLIGAFWDPYGKLDKLPVAVVNEDKGAEMDGTALHVGQDLADELKSTHDFKWEFTDEEEAMSGLQSHRYSMAFVIPEDFSQKAATLKDETPQPAQIQYYVDDGYNYLTSKIGSEASEALRTKVGQAVTKAYADAVFDSVGEAADGFKEASGGASKLADGAKEAEEGAQRLRDNLAKLASGATQVQEGVSKLAGGAGELAAGATTLSSGSEALADGLQQLAAGGSDLASGADQAAAAAGKLAAGAEQLAASGQTLAAGAASAKEGSAGVADGAGKLAAGLQQYAEAHGGMADDAAFQQLLAAAQSVAGGADQLQQGTAALADGAAQLAAGQQSLAAGASELQAGVGQVKAGAGTFGGKLGEASAGAGKLAAGAKELASGAAELSSGLSAADKGLLQVTDGSAQLQGGTQSLASGLMELQDGSQELSSKLGDASGQASELAGTEQQADMFADPIQVEEHKLADIPNYGTGMTPYFLALGLYVGVMLSTIIIPLRDAAGTVRSGWRWYLSKLMLFGPLVLIQVILADTLLIAGLGLDVPNVPLFYAVSAVIGLTFMTIVHFFVTLADNVGRFIAIILLTLQLASSAGTYPSELLPGWLQRIGDWMPMTYAIKAVRYVLGGGTASQIGGELLVLAYYAVVFVALILALFLLRARRIANTNTHMYSDEASAAV
ncbi:YhgE/Pip domain-containing protein [Cohnella lubricantis]|uniref:YhgE/Pip domain-containing protein n=1 Tax=Cohnella lubricantis TaxID=2163172 RepID=A0A841TCW7_9BACL|nr:YhgE/Pip domain-containing protein [Cohnella lubricantis]MBB6676817.1 YhgE/Pip domain-containing protein [Cohnella lubricantis]MBP2120270.1 putative membrane protein [Cohnella lubricantis]